jgi:glutamine synthetase
MLVTNQWVNSYKRLVPGFEAPTYATWSPKNHADLLRVPEHKAGAELSTRVEYRVPDAACNPYLVLAGVLSAGLDGIEQEIPLVAAVERDVREFAPEALEQLGVQRLPNSLGEAIDAFGTSQFAREVFGDQVVESLLANKRQEWAEYRSQITQFELDRYLSVL